ncbi:hypothetical protein EBR96_07665, partial [bacterium]|nr:hypothetical protein [bacterium]
IRENTALTMRIEKSEPSQLVHVELIQEREFGERPHFQTSDSVNLIYVPSRFDGEMDYKAGTFVGEILKARQNSQFGPLVIVLAYNHKAGTESQFREVAGHLARTFADKKLKRSNVQVILQEYTWSGVRYPFGLMRTQLLDRLKTIYVGNDLSRCRLGLIGMDGDVRMNATAWGLIQSAIQDSSKGYFGDTGFRLASSAEKSSGSGFKRQLTQVAFDLDFIVKKALKTKSRPNETCTYMTGSCANLVLSADKTPYPIFDNENSHLLRWLIAMKRDIQSGIDSGEPWVPIKHHLSGDLDSRIVLKNYETFRLSDDLAPYGPGEFSKEAAVALFSRLRLQRQHHAQPRTLAQNIALVYEVASGSIACLAKLFDWKRIIETTNLSPYFVSHFQQDLFDSLKPNSPCRFGIMGDIPDLLQEYLMSLKQQLIEEWGEVKYAQILRKVYLAALAVSKYMLGQVGPDFTVPSVSVTWDAYITDISKERSSTNDFRGRRGQINEPYRRLPGPSSGLLETPSKERLVTPSAKQKGVAKRAIELTEETGGYEISPSCRVKTGLYAGDFVPGSRGAGASVVGEVVDGSDLIDREDLPVASSGTGFSGAVSAGGGGGVGAAAGAGVARVVVAEVSRGPGASKGLEPLIRLSEISKSEKIAAIKSKGALQKSELETFVISSAPVNDGDPDPIEKVVAELSRSLSRRKNSQMKELLNTLDWRTLK